MNIHTTHHAASRMQQRSISELEVELLLRYGREKYQSDGVVVTYFDHRSFKRVERDVMRISKSLGKLRQKYLVTKDSQVLITAGHRT